MYEDEYISVEAFFDLNHSGWHNHNSSEEHKTILITVPIGVLVVIDEQFYLKNVTKSFLTFRTRTHKLLIETDRWAGIVLPEKKM